MVALAEVFGVHPSYFLKTGKKPALLGEREISALGDQRTREILNKSLSLSDCEKDMVLGFSNTSVNCRTASKARLPSGAGLAAGLTSSTLRSPFFAPTRRPHPLAAGWSLS